MENKKYMICPDDNELAQFIEGTLSKEREDYILQHLDMCEECRDTVDLALELSFTENDNHPSEKKEFIPMYHVADTKEGKSVDRLNNCSIKVQHIVLEELGVHVPEKELMEEAIAEGWYVEGKGMLLEHMGKTLECHGISIERKLNASIHDIMFALNEGSKVIVAVDAGELWFETEEEQETEEAEDLQEEIPDHVLLVVGLKSQASQVVKVELKDPGLGKVNRLFPVDRFIDAWKDSKFYLIKTIK